MQLNSEFFLQPSKFYEELKVGVVVFSAASLVISVSIDAQNRKFKCALKLVK